LPANRDTQLADRYHQATKHSPLSVRTNAHYLDFSNQPLPFKIYSPLDPKRLPQEFAQTGVAALSAVAESIRPQTASALDLKTLSQILYFSAGITRSRKYPGGEIYFRAAACTGALYEFELYVVCTELDGLDAGLYHFSPAEFALRKLRAGDYRSVLAAATADEPAVTHAPATIICTGTYWRNAWKYQARTYRHFGWDNGTLLANMLATCTALDVPARVVAGFIDDDLNQLLDLDTEREVAFSMVPIGYQGAPSPKTSAPIEPLNLPVVPLSRSDVDYPLMRETHAASSLSSVNEVLEWREQQTPQSDPRPTNHPIALRPLTDDELPPDPIEKVILRRGSTRQFSHEPISFAQLSTVLDRATRGFPADFHNPASTLMNELYLIVNAVDGLTPGAYYFHRTRRELELLKAGNFRREAGFLGLEQELPADAAVDIFFLADLKRVLEVYGNRGYRAVQLEAGVLGGKLYLCAYALGFGASGLTFYDDDVVEFFSPHASGKSAIFLVCLGKKARKS
jgi:SagB-type dehydrogenase family enzyme